jgi:hypothetical protein
MEDDPFESLPTEVLATILSFTSIDTNEISELLTSFMLTTTTTTSDQEEHNDDDSEDEELIFRALCLLHWDSVAADARPQYFTSWKVLYSVLAQWVHRQGFYSILEAAPWGLLVRLRFAKGRFVGDLVWPTAEDDPPVGGDESKATAETTTGCFQYIPILELCFSENGSVDAIAICSEEMTTGQFSMEQLIGNDETATVEPIVIQGCPANTAGSRALRLRCKEDVFPRPLFMLRNRGLLAQIWDPVASTPPHELVQALLTSRRELTLDFVEGPSRILSFEYKEEMPLIKSGLYSGVYTGIYGKFKREVILIEYVQFEFTYSGETDGASQHQIDSSNNKNWQDILSSVFNHPNQSESLARFERIKEAVTAAKCKKVVFVLGKKVTGDYHVPMKTITFGALVSPIIDLDEPGGGDRPSLSHVTDRGGNGRKEYTVVRSWNGWGTLAFPMFENPKWASGTLVQVRDPDQRYALDQRYAGRGGASGDSRMAQEQFGFAWDEGERGTNTSILTRMSEQEDFAWFA